MIDWDSVIKPENESENREIIPKSREFPTMSGVNNAKVGNRETSIHEDFSDCSLLSLHSLQENDGVGIEQRNNAPVEGGASDNFRDAKTYSVNPIAICLLLTCCNKVTASGEEIFEQILKLQTMPQPEQIRAWAMTCQKYRVDPYSIIYPFIKSSNKGTSCQGCKHIDMQKTPTDNRPVFRFVCGKQHHMLEAFYVGERVLIAPESCTDYKPAA